MFRYSIRAAAIVVPVTGFLLAASILVSGQMHPALQGINIPKTGRADEGGILLTRTLAFASSTSRCRSAPARPQLS